MIQKHQTSKSRRVTPLGAKLFALLLIVSQLFFSSVPAIYADSSPWTQTDWSGGSGQTSWSDATKFSASSNVTTATAGQVTLTPTSNWYNSSWGYRRKITFDNSAQAENLTNFPVLVKLSSSNINYAHTQDSGQDIRFTDADGTTLLSYEIEKWDETGSSYVWVKIPQIDASSNTDSIYMYYGNTSATDGQAPTSVWGSNYKLVDHLGESAGTVINDSSSSNNDGTKVSASEPAPLSSGQVDGAQSFDGVNDYIGQTDTGFPTGASPRTTSAWIKFPSSGVSSFLTYGTETASQRFELGTRTGGWIVVAVNGGAYGTTDIPGPDQWTHVVVTFNGSTVSEYKMYINGVQKTTSMQNGSDIAVNTLSNGVSQIGATIRKNGFYSGAIDEVRVSTSVDSAAWIAAEYKSETDTFNTFGSEEAQLQPSGTLTSSIFDSGYSVGAAWGTLTYSATTPTNSSITVKARTSNSASMTGATAFSSCSAITSGSDISANSCVTDGQRYIQYQLTLATSDSATNPTFQDIAIAFASYDSTGPPLYLVSPNDNSYTNAERPNFTWKAAVDTVSNIANYDLSIDNPSLGYNNSTGDFSVLDIPISGTTDYETTRYVTHYDGFDDANPNNDYLSTYTKSSIDWNRSLSVGENDGKVREGKVVWKVAVQDSAGNTTETARTLFVDRTNPKLEFAQINRVLSPTNGFSTNDTTPTIFGRLTDPLAGGDPSRTQDETGPRVASGPRQVEIKIEKPGDSSFAPLTKTIITDTSWYACDNQQISDNTKQKCDKYVPFEFTPANALSLGTYLVTITGKDVANNEAATTTLTLKVTTLDEITTPEEKQLIQEEIKDLPKEKQEAVKNELEITKPLEPPVSLLTQTQQTLANSGKQIGKTVAWTTQKIWGGLKQFGRTVATTATIAWEWSSNTASMVMRTMAAVTTTITQNSIAFARKEFSNLAFVIGEKTEDISDATGIAIIEFGYQFVSEPTTISNVKVEILSPTSAKISWQTNHPANGKVNYGLDTTYPFDVQSEKRTTDHQFTLTNLQPNTAYSFEVMSQNKNYVYDANREFKTPVEIPNN